MSAKLTAPPFVAGVALAFASLAPADAQQVDISNGSVVAAVANLKAGQFVWAPEVAPQGPMLLIVNLRTQRATLYRNGVPIAASTVSTGKPGHRTPTGIFTILQKQAVHYSSKYDSAPMPYMERLTWYGVALHAGHLPGYPASHGCIRMPADFAKLLYGLTSLGMTVVVADTPSAPRIAPAPELVAEARTPASGAGFSWAPEASPNGPVSVVVSTADRRAIVLRNGIVIGSAPVEVSGPVTGTFAYSLRSMDSSGQHWVKLQLSAAAAAENPVPSEEWRRFNAPDGFRKAIAGIVEPGMTIVVTSDSLSATPSPSALLQSGG